MTTPQIDAAHAPGCFQSALMCAPESPACSTCVFVSRCAPVSADKRAKLHARFGVLATPARKKARPAPAPIVNAPVLISKRAEAIKGAIERTGVPVADTLKAGSNPFEKTPNRSAQFMRVACHLLLRVPRGITRATLIAAFTTKLSLSLEDATKRSADVFEVLTALGAADDHNGRLTLRTS